MRKTNKNVGSKIENKPSVGSSLMQGILLAEFVKKITNTEYSLVGIHS